MSLVAPQRLWLLLAVLAVALAYLLRQRSQWRYALRFTALSMLEVVAPRRPGWRRHVTAMVLGVALAVLVVASARPQVTVIEHQRQAIVMLAIDVSPSMQATDVAPSRLQVAQAAAHEFIAGLPDGFDIGLVAFAGTARLLVPPTTDHERVQTALSEVDLRSETALGEAITVALGAIDAAPARIAGEGRVPAHVLLLSDGANTVGPDPLEAAEASAAGNVPISTVAYGTPDGTVELGDRTVPVPPDPQTLANIAERTGGTPLAAASADELRSAYRRVTSELVSQEVPRDVTEEVLLGGLGLALTSAVLSLLWFRHLP